MSADDRMITRIQMWRAAANLAAGDSAAEDGTYTFDDYVAMVRQVAEDFGLMAEEAS